MAITKAAVKGFFKGVAIGGWILAGCALIYTGFDALLKEENEA